MLYATDSTTEILSLPLSREIKYLCPDCGRRVIPKFCTCKTPHFAHRSHETDCGSKYHDGMSEWHFVWQNTLINPIGGITIEVPVKRYGGTYKRADLKPPHGIVIEFQKSPLPLMERKMREEVYRHMIWVVHTDIENSKVWFKDPSDTIPIFIDRGEYLESKAILGGRISREDFIDKIVNGSSINFLAMRKNYWLDIEFSFYYYNQIEKKIEEEMEWERTRPEREAKEREEAERLRLWREQQERDRIARAEQIRKAEEENARFLEEWRARELKEWESKIIPVAGMYVERHRKDGKPDTLQIHYYLDSYYSFLDRSFLEVNSYLSLGSSGPGGIIARQTIKQFGGTATTIDEAIVEHVQSTPSSSSQFSPSAAASSPLRALDPSPVRRYTQHRGMIRSGWSWFTLNNSVTNKIPNTTS